jgi:hypothetical protein
MQLLRAGVRLSSLIPPKARDEVNAAMAKQGIPFDINQLKPENLEELVDQLASSPSTWTRRRPRCASFASRAFLLI